MKSPVELSFPNSSVFYIFILFLSLSHTHTHTHIFIHTQNYYFTARHQKVSEPHLVMDIDTTSLIPMPLSILLIGQIHYWFFYWPDPCLCVFQHQHNCFKMFLRLRSLQFLGSLNRIQHFISENTSFMCSKRWRASTIWFYTFFSSAYV